MTPRAVFVTGGAGFVGRRLLAALGRTGRPIVALDRSGSVASATAAGGATIATVRSDVLDPLSYREALGSCDTVLHLAAATGRASAAEHDRVNAEGTRVLLDECRRAAVPNFLFVSSIATTFPDVRGYHYAIAKQRAEQSVAASGLRFAILRPTIILGPGAPILAALEKLARLPVIVLPGNGRARVQPIHVDDVVNAILTIVERDRFDNETLEIGGPAVVTMEELLQALRQARTGAHGRVLHIPLPMLRLPLGFAEAIGLGPWLPINAGQLSSFRFDGTAKSNPLQERAGSGLVGLADMVSGAGTASLPTSSPGAAECRVFTRHLIGSDPDAFILAKYADACTVVPALAPAGRFDESLVAFARLGPRRAKIADSYAGLFAPASALRKRLVMLLALLETRPPFSGMIDRATGGPAILAIARLAVRSVGSLLSLLAGLVVFVPLRLVLALAGKRTR